MYDERIGLFVYVVDERDSLVTKMMKDDSGTDTHIHTQMPILNSAFLYMPITIIITNRL